MPEYHMTRFDQMTQAVDTFALLETGPDGSAAGAIQVPAGVSHIRELRVAIGNSAPIATDSGVVFALRLAGQALRDGQQDFVLGSQQMNLETTGAGGFAILQNPPIVIPCHIPVTPTNQLTISAAMRGVDTGTPEIGVEVVFA